MVLQQSPILLGLTVVALTVIGSVQPSESDKCRSGCQKPGPALTFKYTDGTTYKYNYDSRIDFILSSAEGQKTTTEIKAQVLLTQLPQCNQVVQLQNVQIIGPDGKKYGQIPDIEKPIRINFHDGHVEDSICTHADDTQHSLNIKRAVASLFQANLRTVTNKHETDVFGLCPTETTSHKEGNVILVQKTRNLNKCAYREHVQQDFIGASTINLNSEIKSSPLLNAEYTAKLKIQNGILEQATVNEDYLYQPFSVGKNGAKTQIETRLLLTGTSKLNNKFTSSQPRTIIFENPHPVNSARKSNNVNQILNAVKETAKTIDLTVGEKTAAEFINLIRIVKVSNKDDLLAVYNQVRAGVGFGDKSTAKKLFLDALLRAGSGDTIQVAIELLKNKELNDIEQKLVYFGLGLVRHANLASITAVTALLNQPTLPHEAYLGIGSLAGHYCRQHPCKNVDAITKLTQALITKLGDGKAPINRQKENDIIYVLKALANINKLNDQSAAKLTAIAQDKKSSNRLRVTALEAYLSDACRDKLRDSALNLFKDIQLDSELRIKAYLVLAECPTAKIGQAIKQVLDAEPSIQVGGFVASHIRNIRASANPDKALAKQHLGFINLPGKRFPSADLRKYSTNIELSYTIDTLGLANSLESNLIYSQNSFLPRSTSVNLTAEVFGHTFNFLEIQTRQENLDRLIEHYLGPKGLLRNRNIQDLWNKNGKPLVELIEEFKGRVLETLKRSKRDTLTKSDVDGIGKQVQIKTSTLLNNDLDLDLSVKMFGSELLFLNINDEASKWTPDVIIDRIVDSLKKGVDKLKSFDDTIRSNVLFLDAELAYPTSAGFPLRLVVEGSSNVQVKTAGSIDLQALFGNNNGPPPDNTLLKLKLIPSASVKVAGRMTLDAYSIENGLKISSNLHTSTGGDLTLELFDAGQSFDVKFSLPVEKQNLVSLWHDVVFHTRELGAPEVNLALKFAQNKDFSICFDQLNPIIGLTLCAEMNGPNLSGKQVPVLPFPLAGDFKFAATIEREDVSQYHIRKVFHSDSRKLGVALQLEVIGKNNNKKVSLEIEGSLVPEKLIKATLISPITTASLEGRITIDDRETSASLRFKHDTNEYYGRIGLTSTGTSQRQIYKPILEYRMPQQNGGSLQKPYNVEGQIIVERNPSKVKYIFDKIKVNLNPPQSVITLNGNLGYDQNVGFVDLTAGDAGSGKSATFKLQGDLHLQDKKVEDSSLKVTAQLENTYNPAVNFKLKSDLVLKGTDRRAIFIQLVHGNDFNSKTNVLTVSTACGYRYKSINDHLLFLKHEFSYPLFETKSKVEFESKPNKFEYELDFTYKQIKVGSELDVVAQKQQPGDLAIEFDLYGWDNRVDLKAERVVVNEDESKIDQSLKLNGKVKVEITGKIKHHVKPQDVSIGSNLIVKIPTHNVPLKITNGLVYNTNEIDLFHKVAADKTVYVDLFLKASTTTSSDLLTANGGVKITWKNKLIVNGQIKASKGNGNGEITIELPALKRSVKADTQFTIHAPNYNVVLNVYPAIEDPTKKLSLRTNNRVSANNIESSTTIDMFNHKLEVAVKGSLEGDRFLNSKTVGEFEIILPNQHYLAGKINRNFKTPNEGGDDLTNANGLITFEHRVNKNTPGSKLTINGLLRNTNLKTGKQYDGEYSVTCDAGNGRTLNVDFALKRVPTKGAGVDDTTIQVELRNKIYGTVLTQSLDTVITGTHKHRVGSYTGKTSYGPNAVLAIKGKYDLSGGSNGAAPISGDFNLDLTTPSQIVKQLKVDLSGSAKKPKQHQQQNDAPSDYLELSGTTNIYAIDASQATIIDLKTDGAVKVNDKNGQIKGTVKYGKLDPYTIEAGYGHTGGSTTSDKKFNGHILIHYSGTKTIKTDITLLKVAAHELKLDWTLDLPTEKHRTNRLLVNSKRSEDNKHHESEIQLTSDGETHTIHTDIVLSELAPSLSIKAKCPSGKLSELLVKINKISSKQFTSELKLIYQAKEFEFQSNIDANIETIEDFNVKITAHCPALKLNKIYLEAVNKPSGAVKSGGGRRIQVTIKSVDKNVLSGSTSYTAREEQGGKLIVEGSGSFKVKEETKSANFKYIRQNLVQDVNGETGIEVSFDAGLGKKAIDAELKITNKQFRILNSYCEEKKECAHIEIDSKTNVDDITHFNQELEIAVDLRKLGLSHEFGLKVVTTRKDYLTLDHTVDIHFQSDENSKYKYSIYLHPKEGGISLTTPKRTIALEATVDYPNTLKNGGKISSDFVFYLDKKNQPNQKTSLAAWLSFDDKYERFQGETKYTNPGLNRALSTSVQIHYDRQKKSATAHVEIDLFAEPNQKLIFTLKQDVLAFSQTHAEVKSVIQLKSVGLQIDISEEEAFVVDRVQRIAKYNYNVKYNVGQSRYDSAYRWEVSPSQFTTLLRVLNRDLLKLNTQYKFGGGHDGAKGVVQIDAEVQTYGLKATVSHLEVKNWNTLKYFLAKKDSPHNKLQISTGLIPGQIADFRAEILQGSGQPTKELAHFTVKLDDAQFLKPDFGIDSKNIRVLVLEPLKNIVTKEAKELRTIVETIVNDLTKEVKQFVELFKKATPNFAVLKQYYANELKKFRDEIAQDKTIKHITELLRNIGKSFVEAFGETLAKFSELVENVARSIQQSFAKVLEVIEKEIVPKFKENSKKVLDLFVHIFERTADIIVIYFAKISEFCEKFEPELREISTVLSGISQDVGRFVAKLYESILVTVRESWTKFYAEIKALPVFEQLREQFDYIVKNSLPSREVILNGFNEAAATIRDILPNDDLKHLLDDIVAYVQLKLKQTDQVKVDDLAAISKIIQTALEALRKIIDSIVSQVGSSTSSGGAAAHTPNLRVPFFLLQPVDVLRKLPKLVAAKFSPITYLLTEETRAVEFVASLVNRPRNLFAPFPLYGIIAQGQHIFTFDGKHLTFPGKCQYLLARDAVNGNFTIVGTYANGLLTEISLVSQNDDIVTLKKGGQVTLNGAPTELPARKPNLAAFRDYEKIELKSTAGVRIVCEPNLVVCSIRVSGFYHGQLRGLLGNGNNEPYDDFTTAAGKIVTSEGEFGNSYKLKANCPVIKTVSHQHQNHDDAAGVHHTASSCAKLFGWESSSLRYCYPFVNTDNFKMACEHGVAAGVKDTEFAVAVAYVAACNEHGIPIRVPKEFVKCTNSEQLYNVGDTFSVKTPSKTADIVLLIDTVDTNAPVYKDYVQPLIQQLSNELHAKGINDVEYHLVTYGGDNQWPSHVTVAGKLTFKGKSPALKFASRPRTDDENKLVTGFAKVDQFFEILRKIGYDLRLAVGLTLQQQTYEEGLQYPFRAESVKTIIAVTSEPCEVGSFLPLQIVRTWLYRGKNVNINLITPFSEITLSDANNKHTAKDVVGFNNEDVFLVSHAKNKPKPHGSSNSELYKQLNYNDYCVDFTIQNRGNVFVANNFLVSKGVARKQFVQTTSHHIVEQMTGREQGLDCECKYISPFSVSNVCKVAFSKEKLSIAVKKGVPKG